MRIATILLSAILSVAAYASQEGAVPLSAVSVQSEGIGESGPISVEATQTFAGMQSFVMEAFGRKFELNQAQLKQLGTWINAIQLSYAGGYDITGGRTLYIKLSRSYTSGQVHGNYVVVKESGAVEIRETLP